MSEILDIEAKSSEKPRKIQKGFVIAEIVLFCFIGLGLVFKLLHWPGAPFLLIIGFGFFSTLMFPLGLFYRNWQMKVINFFFSNIMVAILFMLMLWPKAHFYLLIGLCCIPLLILFLFLLIRKYQRFIHENKLIFSRIILFSLFTIVIYLMPIKSFYGIFMNDDPIEAELYEASVNNPENESMRQAYIKYRNKHIKAKRFNYNTPDSTNAQ